MPQIDTPEVTPQDSNQKADGVLKADGVVKAAKIGLISAIITTLITATATFFGGIYTAKANEKRPSSPPIVVMQPSTVPPPTNVKQVQSLPEDPDDANFETLRDVSVFDLRGWKQLAPDEKNPRSSPANYINYLHVKKIRPAKSYKAHYHTNGTGIDIRCMTHSFDILEKQKPDQHIGGHEYEVDVNVEDMPVDKEFLIVIEATYWNSFQNLTEEDASTYTDKDMREMQELSLFVLFPEQKPFKQVERLAGPTGGGSQGFRDLEKFYEDKDHRFFYWDIIKRSPDYHYQAKWSW